MAVGPTANATQNGVAIGSAATASPSSGCVAVGYGSTASGASSVTVGGNTSASGANTVVVGRDASATASGGIAIGKGASSAKVNSIAMGADLSAGQDGSFEWGFTGNQGGMSKIARSLEVMMLENTTDATVTNLVNNAGGRLVIPASTVWLFEIDVVARRSDVFGIAAYTFVGGVLERDGANNTTLRAAPTKAVLYETDVNYDVAVTADDVNEALQIAVTGVAAHTVDWLARVRILPLS